MRSNEEHRKHGEKEKERRKDRERRERNDKDFEHDGVQHFPHKRKATCGIEDAVADRLHQGAEVAENIGMHPGSSSYDNKTAIKSEWLCYFWILSFGAILAMPFSHSSNSIWYWCSFSYVMVKYSFVCSVLIFRNLYVSYLVSFLLDINCLIWFYAINVGKEVRSSILHIKIVECHISIFVCVCVFCTCTPATNVRKERSQNRES